MAGDEGSFWIPFTEFVEEFEKVFVCKVQEWNEVRIRSRFIKAKLEGDDGDEVISKFHYTLKISKKSEVVIGLHQEDFRILGAAQSRP